MTCSRVLNSGTVRARQQLLDFRCELEEMRWPGRPAVSLACAVHETIALHRRQQRSDRVGCHADLRRDVLDGQRSAAQEPDDAPAARCEKLLAEHLIALDGTPRCDTCHPGPTFTDVGTGRRPVLHDADEIGVDPRYASRSATGQYRATPLRALWQHPPYFHDGSARTLLAVVNHYNAQFRLNLTERQKADLVEFLKSL